MAVFTVENLRKLLCAIRPDRASVARVAREFRVYTPEFRLATLYRLVGRAVRSGDVESDASLGLARRICLSPLGAEREGVRLDEQSMRWVPVGGGWEETEHYDRDHTTYYCRTQRLSGRILSAEAVVRWAREGEEKDWHAERLLASDVPWNGPNSWPTGDQCPFHGKRVANVEYCLWCDAASPLNGEFPDAGIVMVEGRRPD